MEKRAGRTRKIIWISVLIIFIYLILLYNIGVKVDYIIWNDQIEEYQSLNHVGLIVSIICSAIMLLSYMLLKRYKISIAISLFVLIVSVGMLGYSLLQMPDWEQIRLEQQKESALESQTESIDEALWSEVLLDMRYQ